MARYQAKLSGPFLDRIDVQVEVPAVAPATLAAAAEGESSEQMAARVSLARQTALSRQGCSNAALSGPLLDRHCPLDASASRFLQGAAARLGWSGRGYHRVLRVARTIADLAGAETIQVAHLAEAIQYRRVLSVG